MQIDIAKYANNSERLCNDDTEGISDPYNKEVATTTIAQTKSERTMSTAYLNNTGKLKLNLENLTRFLKNCEISPRKSPITTKYLTTNSKGKYSTYAKQRWAAKS